MIGKKEDVGRPILYGTTPEFLRTFSLRDLTELPTLREFHELSEAHLAEVEAKAKSEAEPVAGNGEAAAGGAPVAPTPSHLVSSVPEEQLRTCAAFVSRRARIRLTSSSSAAPSEGAGRYLLQRCNHESGRKQAG